MDTQHIIRCDELWSEITCLGDEWEAAPAEDRPDIGRTIDAVQREIDALHASGQCPGSD
jgi:hypothetical protein